MCDFRYALVPLALTGLLAACSRPTAPEVTSSELVFSNHVDPSSGYNFTIGTLSGPSAGCPGDRLIGIRRPSTSMCPPAGPAQGGHWSVDNAFDTNSGGLPPALDRYCAYQWHPGFAGSPPDVSPGVLPLDGHDLPSEWLYPDCNVVGAAASPFGDHIGPELERAFFEQVERVDPLPSGPTAVGRTRVWVVDSAVDRAPPYPGFGQLDHGRVVGLVIRKLSCPVGGPCAGAVASDLALKLEYDTNGQMVRNESMGGYFGSTADLARSIVQSTQRAMLLSTDRLVINLSVAWEPTYGGDFVNHWSELTPQIRIVYHAIAHARCAGAIVIAAAGNSSAGPLVQSGGMYPAAWEEKGLPNASECAALGFPSMPTSASTYEPLVYAVGAVDGADVPLSNARPAGLPALLAPGAHVSVLDVGAAGPPTPSTALHGSSMSAAVVSAVAATAWSYQPTLTASDVMELVYNSSVPLNGKADFCLGGAPCTRTFRRASMCRAVADACVGSPHCTAPPPCGVPNAYRNARPNPTALPASMVTASVSALPLTQTAYVGWPCFGEVVSSSAKGPVAPCPASQMYLPSAEPWVEPQPHTSGCPTCVFSGNFLDLGLAEELPGLLTEPTLHVVDHSGAEKFFALDIPDTELVADAAIQVTDLPVDSEEISKAAIQFIVDGAYASEDQLIIFK